MTFKYEIERHKCLPWTMREEAIVTSMLNQGPCFDTRSLPLLLTPFSSTNVI